MTRALAILAALALAGCVGLSRDIQDAFRTGGKPKASVAPETAPAPPPKPL